MKPRRRRDAALLAAGAVLVAGVWLLERGKDAPAVAAKPAAVEVVTWAPPSEPPHRVDTLEGPSPAKQADVHFIKDVFADGDDVCVNEPVTVLVAASDDRPNPRPIYVKVNANDGSPSVVSFQAPGDPKVLVRADDQQGTFEQRVLAVHVRDCGGTFQLVRIDASSIPSRPGTFGLTAHPYFARQDCAAGGRVNPDCATKMDPGDTVRYEWDFGDGQTAGSKEPYVEHDYSGRSQTSVQASFLVRVVATSTLHGTLQGATSVGLANLAYQNRLLAGVITPEALSSPGARNGRTYTFTARFRSYEGVPLRFTKAKVEAIPCDEAAKPSFYDASADEILESPTLPPGPSETTTTLRGNLVAEQYCRALITLEGKGPGGLLIHAVLGAVVKPPAPTEVVTFSDDGTGDPQAKQRIDALQKAIALLGRDPQHATISDEEIDALKRKGLLQ